MIRRVVELKLRPVGKAGEMEYVQRGELPLVAAGNWQRSRLLQDYVYITGY